MDHRTSNHAPASTARTAQRLQIINDYRIGQVRKEIANQDQQRLIDARKVRLDATIEVN
jgi:hypothetical protein